MKQVYENEFVERWQAPTKAEARYTRKAYGGWSPCIDGSPKAWEGSVLSNCVGYAFGRFAEIGDMTAEECKLGRVAGVEYPQSASAWWNGRSKMGYETGAVAKLGACGCWIRNSDGLGHVMICERINADGSVRVSYSSYGGVAFDRDDLPSNYEWHKANGWKFQGWIYNPAVIPNPYPATVERDESKHQYEVTINDLYWRKGAGRNFGTYKDFVKAGIYNVLETKENGGWTWNKIADDYWFAGAYGDKDTHGVDYPAKDDKDKRIEELEGAINKALAILNGVISK